MVLGKRANRLFIVDNFNDSQGLVRMEEDSLRCRLNAEISLEESQRLDLGLGELPRFAGFKLSEMKSANGRADQSANLVSQCRHHASHLAIATLGQDDLQDRGLGVCFEAANLGGPRHAVVQYDALP